MPRMSAEATAKIEANMDYMAAMAELDSELSALRLAERSAIRHCNVAEHAAEHAIEAVRAAEGEMKIEYCKVGKIRQQIAENHARRRAHNEAHSIGEKVDEDAVVAA